MSLKPQNVIMLFTDKVEEHGVSHSVFFHVLVYMVDDVNPETIAYQWHYYGTPVPTPLPYVEQFPTATAMQHPETLFPPALNDLPDSDMTLYGLAWSVESNRLSL